jgi:hypothetical protein
VSAERTFSRCLAVSVSKGWSAMIVSYHMPHRHHET